MSTSVRIDVDLDDILWGMSDREKQDLVEELYEDGYSPKELEEKEAELKDDFSIACKKLMGQAWRLTKAEEEFIINISKRF
jgi:hypothetical protein